MGDFVETAIRGRRGGVRAESANGRGGGSARSASPGAGPATASSQSAVSSTVRVTDPATLSPCQCSAYGIRLTRPRCVFSPTSPQHDAGILIEPPPSLAEPAAARPAATADAEPPLEPPAERSGFQGFLVFPNASDSVQGKVASSGRLVLPITIAPASRRRRTCSESAPTGSPWPAEPLPVNSPARSRLSFTATGTPSSSRSSPAPARPSAC